MALQYIMPPEGNFDVSKDAPAIRMENTRTAESRRRKGLAMIVAAGLDGEIGRAGDMIWHMPDDLRHFKQLTMGAVVVMGRKTWESLPKRPLPGRRNVVVSRNGDYRAGGAEVYPSLAAALEACAADEAVFIIGGGELYRQGLPLASRVEFTRVFARCPDADTYFPELPESEWRLDFAGEQLEAPSGVKYRFETYLRKE